MHMDGPAVPFALSDPGSLADGLGRTRGTGGQVWLTVAPQQQPMLERKGLLGRRKQEPAAWSLAVQDWAGRNEPADWSIWCTLPAGVPLSRRGVALPAGATVESEADDDAMLRLPPGTPEATVAAELCRLAVTLLAPAAPGGWFWRVGDSSMPYYNVDLFDV